MRHPAYHLRTNKAVDRLTFIAQMKAVLGKENQAKYYSLSGPFLEDMKLAHLAFPTMKLVSLETNTQTFKRQQFHNFTSRLKLLNESVEYFLSHTYDPGEQDFFWLDFTTLELNCFQSFRKVLEIIPHMSLVRMTLRAEPNRSLVEIKNLLSTEQVQKLEEVIDEKFVKEFGTLLSHDALKTPLCSAAEHARTVQLMVKRSASEALDNGAERDFFHLSTTRYQDGVQMISVTGIILARKDANTAIRTLAARGLNVDQAEWAHPIEIEVPSLSVLERHWIDRHLPKRDSATLGKTLMKKLKYYIDNGERRSEEALRQYARHYRDYPTFIKGTY